jgi:signal transduction histidine kinase
MAVAKIQHDLRNILSSAQIASDRLVTSADPVVQRVTPRLVDALGRAIALATNTLRYGRAEERTPQRTCFLLAPLVEEVAALGLPEGAGVAFANHVPNTLEIDADSEQLFRAVLNLLRNGREALESIPASDTRDKRITVQAERKDQCVIIEISDTGPGIPSAVRDRLFRPFSATARPGSAGLGLAISRELLQAHGGDVVLLATNESGTRFRLSIPDRKS